MAQKASIVPKVEKQQTLLCLSYFTLVEHQTYGLGTAHNKSGESSLLFNYCHIVIPFSGCRNSPCHRWDGEPDAP